MKSYVFSVEVEPEDDVWRVRVPVLASRGASTWGYTKESAMQNIEDVVRLIVKRLLAEGEPFPAGVRASDSPVIAVNVESRSDQIPYSTQHQRCAPLNPPPQVAQE